MVARSKVHPRSPSPAVELLGLYRRSTALWHFLEVSYSLKTWYTAKVCALRALIAIPDMEKPWKNIKNSHTALRNNIQQGRKKKNAFKKLWIHDSP